MTCELITKDDIGKLVVIVRNFITSNNKQLIRICKICKRSNCKSFGVIIDFKQYNDDCCGSLFILQVLTMCTGTIITTWAHNITFIGDL